MKRKISGIRAKTLTIEVWQYLANHGANRFYLQVI